MHLGLVPQTFVDLAAFFYKKDAKVRLELYRESRESRGDLVIPYVSQPFLSSFIHVKFL